MPIIIHSKDQNLDWSRINLYPDQFLSHKEKQEDDWIKHNMDYFANVSYSQFVKSRDTFLNNYNLVKGILTPQDFYVEPEVRSFVDTLTRDVELPAHVKHYPAIFNPPLATMVGELTSRPDGRRVKAFDDMSRSEEAQFKTEITKQFIFQEAKKMVMTKLALKGQIEMPSEEELDEITYSEVEDTLTDYTSLAERWGNMVLEAMKAELNIKEISEDCFRDMIICSREFYHIFEDNTKLGFGLENLNPKNVWYLTLPDKKYISDPSMRNTNAFAAGTVHVMELSEIIMRFDLSKEEIDHLRKGVRELSLFSPRESNLNDSQISGWDSIKYDTYSPLIVQQRLILESTLKENRDPLNDFLGLSSNVNTFGNKYVVVQAYWLSKEKVGLVTYMDENGDEQQTLVSEEYEKIPNQIGEVKWDYINCWYKGYKIGPDVYNVQKFRLLDYCPIIGVIHEIKNLEEAKSLIDLLKPYQILYNVCMNQLFKLLEKEVGMVYLTSPRQVPIPKDGDAQDALEMWEEEARAKGIVFIDDSPENLKAASNLNINRTADWTRTQEIQSRYTLAIQLKNEALELVGITRQRLGGTTGATETATATQTGLSQSYAQTEPLFAQHDYVLNQVYQAILDAAQTVALENPSSTISFINAEGVNNFMEVNTQDLRMRDLKVFVTHRPEDKKMFEEIKLLAQPMLQNGASPYDVAAMYSTNSVRQMKDILKGVKEKQEQFMAQQQQMEQAQLEQAQQQFQAQLEQEAYQEEINRQFEAYESQLDRLSKERIAIIQATGFGKVASEDLDQDAIPDVLEASKITLQQQQMMTDSQFKSQDLLLKNQQESNRIRLEMEKLKVQRENMRNDEKIARINAASKKAAAKKSATKKKK